MVLLFLRQLATPGSSNNQNESSEEHAEDTPLIRSNYKIEIPLVDRKRADAEGCVYVPQNIRKNEDEASHSEFRP
jgi:hypothetical protein